MARVGPQYHGGKNEDSHLVGCDAVMWGRFFLTFRRNRWRSSSGPSSSRRTAMQKQDKDTTSDPIRLECWVVLL
jgi:hypothetical protein